MVLNGLDYKEYLLSDDWLRIRKLALTRPHYKKCYVCSSEGKLELHHRTYKWIGTKDSMRGLIALCRDCHQEIHDYAKEYNISVRKATRKVWLLHGNVFKSNNSQY